MNRKTALLLLLSFTVTCNALASNFKHPAALEQISEASVFGIAQDSTGAIWIGTSNGIYRYNGSSLETVSMSPLPYHQFATAESGRYIYAADRKSILRFDACSESWTTIRAGNVNCAASPFCVAGDSLVLAYGKDLFVSRGDTLVRKQILPEAPNSIISVSGGIVLFGCESGNLYLTGPESAPEKKMNAGSPVRSLYERDGEIWVGTDGTILRLDGDYRETGRWTAARNIRAIAGNGKGETYFGSPVGLFKIDSSGKLSRQEMLSSIRIPVFQILTDWNGDIWAGTLDNGCLYSNESSFPFETLSSPSGARSLHGMVKDGRGDVWVLTDAYGLHRKTGNGWRIVPGTEDIKFQFCYKDGGALWTSDYMGDLLRLDLGDGSFRRFSQREGMRENFWAAARSGDRLYIGGSSGLFLLEESGGGVSWRKIPGVDLLVHCIDIDKDGRLWLGTREGVYSYMPGNGGARKEFEGKAPLDRSYVSDIICLDEGGIAAALLGRGAALATPDGNIRTYRERDGSLPGNHTLAITEFDGLLIVGCKEGLSVIDPKTGECRIYSGNNAIRFAKDCSYIDAEGGLVFAGADGIYRLAAGTEIPARPHTNLCFDHIRTNGRTVQLPSRLPQLESVEFNHEVKSLAIEVATFDYPEVTPASLEYMMDGYSYDWAPFDSRRPIEFGNVRAGRYDLHVRDRGGESISLGIRIRPAWYACLAARISYVLIFLLVASILIRQYLNRKLLAGELEREKEESKRKTVFFLELSNSIRTPLNLLMGQIEKYFRNYGTRAQGIDDIEEAYADAGRIRKMISEYVDSQSEDALTDEERQRAADARFLNALTAVIESNLFSEDIDTAFLCERMNMGRTTLTTRLRETTGRTPHEFTEDIRLRHAAEMLLKGNKRVADIASDLRYCSARYFADCFRRKFGCNPSDYKG